MGWASGSGLAQEVWDSVKAYIPKRKKAEVAREIIAAFEQEDADTMQEAEELWDAAFERCACWDPVIYDFNQDCTTCDGLGWIER